MSPEYSSNETGNKPRTLLEINNDARIVERKIRAFYAQYGFQHSQITVPIQEKIIILFVQGLRLIQEFKELEQYRAEVQSGEIPQGVVSSSIALLEKNIYFFASALGPTLLTRAKQQLDTLSQQALPEKDVIPPIDDHNSFGVHDAIEDVFSDSTSLHVTPSIHDVFVEPPETKQTAPATPPSKQSGRAPALSAEKNQTHVEAPTTSPKTGWEPSGIEIKDTAGFLDIICVLSCPITEQTFPMIKQWLLKLVRQHQIDPQDYRNPRWFENLFLEFSRNKKLQSDRSYRVTFRIWKDVHRSHSVTLDAIFSSR